jgi:hypothetical protein
MSMIRTTKTKSEEASQASLFHSVLRLGGVKPQTRSTNLNVGEAQSVTSKKLLKRTALLKLKMADLCIDEDVNLGNLFDMAKKEIARLETKHQSLLEESQFKDRQLASLLESKSLLFLSGPNRDKLLQQLVPTSVSDGLFPFHIETKYFHVDIVIHCSTTRNNQHPTFPHAIILALDHEFNQELAEFILNNDEEDEAEVKLLICNDDSCKDWCIDNGVEWIEWSSTSPRVMEALSSTIWPSGLVMKPKPVAQASAQQPQQQVTKAPTPKRPLLSAEEEMEMFDKLMGEAKAIKETSTQLNDEERRKRAGEAAEKMMALFGMDSEDEDD